MPMFYCTDIQADTVREKMRLLMAALIENVGDNDEALDVQNRTMDKLEYQDGFEFVAVASLGFYWSSGTGTPMQDKLIERLIDAQAAEWAEQFPDKPGMLDLLAGDDSPDRDEASEWEMAALDDEVIYLRIEFVRDHGDIKFRSCFMNEINIPYGDEYEVELSDAEFLALEGDELEAFANRIAAAPYEAKLED